MNGAQAVVQMMEAYSIEYIFGVPGDTSLPLYQALYERRHKIRHVLARDERSAGFMADAYSRLTHRPGVCECPSGAGALYSIPGIAEANLIHLFDPFFSTRGVGQGRGLGLSVCYGIIADHNGRIDVKSQLGKGSVFTVELPVVPEESGVEVS